MSDDLEDPAYEAFEQAKQAFRKRIVNSRAYDEILNTTTINDVYRETFRIQEEFSSNARLKYMAKIRPFLDRLSELSLVIEVFVQVKPDLLALIWGPIKLILLLTSKVSDALDAIAAAMESIGQALPQFATLAETFPTSPAVRAALALFYGDILDFYSTILDLLQNRSWKSRFKTLWHGPQAQLQVVIDHLETHKRLLTEEATLLDIKEAKEARTRALLHFAKTETDQQSSKYQSLKARISPVLYDDRLDWLQNRSVPHCDSWLLRNKDFLDWASAAEKKTAWFWLNGIPGAGKTYLAASAIDQMKQQGRTLFAFVSHANSVSRNARSIILSLIFQAAEDDQDFQSVLIDSNGRDIRGSTAEALLILQNYLTTAGLTYIIIDGLDEMIHEEYKILLRRLDELASKCEDLRLFISSRTEDDISRTITGKAVDVRVDKNNFGGIETYVDFRGATWMDSRHFTPDIRSELTAKISPLSASAGGMMLYVRIVMDNLEHLSTIDEIRDELRAPPKDLKDAYHRIFDRINHLAQRDREKARKVLGLIGSAPAPLTRFEMEQALSINPDPRAHTDGPPRVLTNMEFVKLCGPIIELVGEELQFVHFTVAEYIFSKDIQDFIDKERAAANLTFGLLAYLSAVCPDLDLDDSDIDENILRGNYRLFEYASFFWPRCLDQMDPTRKDSVSLGQLFDRIIEGGSNGHFQPPVEDLKRTYMNQHLERVNPEAHRMVCESFRFRLIENRWQWSRDNRQSWIEHDPLNLSDMWIRIQERLEELAALPEHQSYLHAHYGTGLLRCIYPFCERSYRGFQFEGDRKKHILSHGKPWKCAYPDCPFASLGFSTKAGHDDHWLKIHIPTLDEATSSLPNIEKLDVFEAHPVLFILVRDNNVEMAKKLLSAPGGRKLKAETLSRARLLAANLGLQEMTSLLAPSHETNTPYEIVVAAVKSREATFAREAISKAQWEDHKRLMIAIVRTGFEDMYTLWEEHILEMPRERMRPGYREPKDMYDEMFKRGLFTEIKDHPEKEALVRRTLTKLSDRMEPRLLGALLLRVAMSSCSLSLATELVRMGAPVDYPTDFGGVGMTALHAAAKKTSREAALLMQYLISQGASMKGRYRPVNDPAKIGRERGAREMFKYVGYTYEELRSQQTSARAIDLDN